MDDVNRDGKPGVDALISSLYSLQVICPGKGDAFLSVLKAGAGVGVSAGLTQDSSAEAKIALFRSLFRGREDVYPRRFESRKTGRAGYQPACGNEWIRGVCEKPRVKCSDCPNQRFLPVTDEVVRWHVSGRDGAGHDFVMGVYPLLRDETCHLLAVDFDRDNWRADAAAFVETCRRLAVPVALERSRSGKCGHVWFFFDEPVPAITQHFIDLSPCLR